MATTMITTHVTINPEDLKITKCDSDDNETTVCVSEFPVELIDKIEVEGETSEGKSIVYKLSAASEDYRYTITTSLIREAANVIEDPSWVVLELVTETLREARGVRRLAFDWKATPDQVMEDVALALEEHGLVVTSIASGIDEYWFDLRKRQK